MIEITFSSSFRRAFKKMIKSHPFLETKFWERVEIFQNNPFDNRLKTHSLSGRLKDLWSFSIDYDNRVIFSFVDTQKYKVLFVDIGSHDVVY